jgi:phage terminase large subunit GpA-like protein
VRGFPKWHWEKTRRRNEQLDCRVMARAALAGTGADRWTAEQWEARAGRVGMKVTRKLRKETPRPAAKRAPQAEVAPAVAAQPERKAKRESGSRRGGWLASGGGSRWL